MLFPIYCFITRKNAKDDSMVNNNNKLYWILANILLRINEFIVEIRSHFCNILYLSIHMFIIFIYMIIRCINVTWEMWSIVCRNNNIYGRSLFLFIFTMLHWLMLLLYIFFSLMIYNYKTIINFNLIT